MRPRPGGPVAVLLLLLGSSADSPAASAARSVKRLQGPRDPGAATRACDASASDISASIQANRPSVLDRCQLGPAARTLAGVPHYARDIDAMASRFNREALDVHGPTWSSTDSTECPSARGPARARESALGLPAHRCTERSVLTASRPDLKSCVYAAWMSQLWKLTLTRFDGHLSKGEYDGHDGGHQAQADPAQSVRPH
jgi:hypothetical protein